MRKDTYIIIVTYNGLRNNWIKNCLLSIENQFSLENVIIVDNNSSDETVEFIKTNFSGVNLFPLKKNLGFGEGNNVGIKYAYKMKANFFLLLNQDCYLDNGVIQSMVDSADENKIQIISPFHFCDNSKNFDLRFRLCLEKSQEFVEDLKNKQYRGSYLVPFVNAACWLLTKETISQIGYFDPIFKHYGEDDNYCQRLLYHGGEIRIYSGISVIHDRMQSERIKNLNFYKVKILKDYANILFPFNSNKYKAEILQSIKLIYHDLGKGMVQLDEIKKIFWLLRIKKRIKQSRRTNEGKSV